jgi:RNA polymerase sigma factor (sigma-70 family)
MVLRAIDSEHASGHTAIMRAAPDCRQRSCHTETTGSALPVRALGFTAEVPYHAPRASARSFHDLLTKAISGDDAAFACVQHEYGPAIRARIRQFVILHRGHPIELGTDDLSQEVWIRVWRYWQAKSPGIPDNPRAWFCRVAVNACIDRLRKAIGRSGQEANHPEVISLEGLNVQDPGERQLLTRDDSLGKRVRLAMTFELTEQERRLVTLHYIQGLTWLEAAEGLGITCEQARHLSRKAIGKLRSYFSRQ